MWMPLILALMMAAPATTPPPAPAVLSTAGIGDVKIGMDAATLKRRFAAKVEDITDPKDPNSCGYYSLPAYPGLGFMVTGGALARIDVTKPTPAYATLSGARVGMRTADVRKIYGSKLRIEPHKYNEENGKYLVLASSDGRTGLILETDKDVVTSFRIGRWEEVQWVEGCY
jgi:hypothetical protein